MPSRRTRLIAAEIGAASAVLLAAGLQRRHLRRIADDPEQAVLREPAAGRPVGVRSPDGTQLHVEVFGPEDGETFVLAHGWTEMLAYWIYVTRQLVDRGFRVAAYDQRGHGQSEPAANGDYAIGRFGEDLEAVLEAVLEGDRRAIVVGHSLGAMSIAAWAEHHDVERRASAAALLNTGVGDLVTENLVIPVPLIANAINRTVGGARFISARRPVPPFSTPVSHAIMRYLAFGPAASPGQIAFFERMLVACPPDVRADVGMTISELELWPALARLTIPTLVLAGALDRLTPPSHARRIAAAVPRLHRLTILEDTAHMAPLERPAEVTEALLELSTAVGAQSTSVSV